MKYCDKTTVKFILTKLKNLFVSSSEGKKSGILKANGAGGLSAATGFTGQVTTSSTGDYLMPAHTHTWDTFPELQTFYLGTTAPTNTKVFWIDPNEGIKFYVNSTIGWTLIPGGYS